MSLGYSAVQHFFHVAGIPPALLVGIGVFCLALAGYTAWRDEHEALEKAERDLNEQSPKLYLEYSQNHAAEFLTHSGLLVRNAGKRAAFKVSLSCESTAKARLRFEEMPIQRIDSDKGESVCAMCLVLDNDGSWRPIGGTQGGQIESCFERLSHAGEDERIPIMITYTEYEGKKEHTTRCMIRRDSEVFSTRIWCELA